MKPRYIFLLVLVVGQLAFALIPLIPVVSKILPGTPSQREQLDWQVAILGFGFAIMTACIAIMTILNERDRDAFEKRLVEILPNTRIERLRDDEFYDAFLAAAKQSRSSVNIMYLAPTPPHRTNNPDRIEYYAKLLTTIKKKPEVRFNRIVRQSPENRDWIAGLITALTNCPNASIAALKDHETEEMPLSLSVQVVDNTKVWFVAIQAHERVDDYRDLYVHNSLIADAMTHYFKRIWDRSKPLLTDGQITAEGRRYIQPT
jgi:hypothetical protein